MSEHLRILVNRPRQACDLKVRNVVDLYGRHCHNHFHSSQAGSWTLFYEIVF